MSQKLRVASVDRQIPEGATHLANSSGNVAAAAAVATLTPVSGQKAHISGFIVTASGATAGLDVSITITGVIGGTQTHTFTFPAGALVAATPLVVNFPINLPATGPDVNIVVTVPSGGLGNTNSTVVAYGYSA